MTRKQVKRFKCIDNDPNKIKRFTRSSLRQKLANLTEAKELNQSSESSAEPDTLKNKTQFEKLKSIAGRPLRNPPNKNSKKSGKDKATIETNNSTNMVPPHLAKAVFGETTGKMMEMRDLVRHPDQTIRN